MSFSALKKTIQDVDWPALARNLALITAGSAIYTVGIKSILIPHHFLNGGITGISLILVYLFDQLNLGLVYAALNVPLFILGWFTVSRQFIAYTCFGIAVFSVLADFMPVGALAIQNPILAAVFAGVICGVGCGVILRSAGSGGGVDILSVHLYQKYAIKLGSTYFVANAIVLCAAAFFFGLEKALYTLIFIYTQSYVMDLVIAGFNRRKSVIIISDKSREIAQAVMDEFRHGVTFLEGRGAYSGKSQDIIFSIVPLTELGKTKEISFRIDPNAFIVINDTLDVFGSTTGSKKTF